MQYIYSHKVFAAIIIFGFLVMLIVLVDFLIIKYSGSPVNAPEIPRARTVIGSGEKLNYAVLGDSTSIAQGANYSDGYAVQTAEKMAESKEVTFQNFGVSGARVSDVLNDQLPKIGDFKPDLVLIGIGANDVTHFTSLKSIEDDMNLIISRFREINPNIKIVLTGSPEMGSIPRFPQPAKWIMGWRTSELNKVMEAIAIKQKVNFAYIARETGKEFSQHPEYFAQDKFHPNAEGYAVWVPVLNSAIEQALKTTK